MQEEQKKIMEEWGLEDLLDREAPEPGPSWPHTVLDSDICL